VRLIWFSNSDGLGLVVASESSHHGSGIETVSDDLAGKNDFQLKSLLLFNGTPA
jgi:hypothetical protein